MTTQSGLAGRARTAGRGPIGRGPIGRGPIGSGPIGSGPIGRGPKVRAAVLAATLAELAGTGYAALTVENVARRAGVHKTTIYRRWKDREGLVTDAMTDLAATQVPFPDTGDIDTDLRRLARGLVAFLNSPAGQALAAATLSDAGRIPGVADAKHRFFADRFRRAQPVISAAIARGEIPAGTDPAELIRTLVAPIYLRLLVTGEPIDATTADKAAKVALAAARAGALRADPATGAERPIRSPKIAQGLEVPSHPQEG